MTTQGAHTKVVTVRHFREHASEISLSNHVILVTREGPTAGRFQAAWSTKAAVDQGVNESGPTPFVGIVLGRWAGSVDGRQAPP